MKPEPRHFDVFAPQCPSRQTFERIFSRWGLLVLARLDATPRRFGEIHEVVGGISERLLAQTLKVLKEEGLVCRKSWPEKPPRVEYWLSPQGMEVSKKIEDLIDSLYGTLKKRLADEAEVPAGGKGSGGN